MRDTRYMAVFMSFLIVSIPMISADAMARSGYFGDVQVSGESGLPGQVARTDSLNVNATVFATGDNGDRLAVEASDVKLTFGTTTESFSSCEDTGSSYYCTYKGEKRDFAGGSYKVTAKLYDESNIRLAQKEAQFFVDASPPRVLSLSISKSGQNALSIYYDIVDTACPACGSACIGLEKAELKVSGTVRKTLEVSGCQSQGTVTLTYSELGIKDGTQEICIAAEDRYLQKSEYCSKHEVDSTPPQFQAFRLTDLKGIDLSYSSIHPIPVLVSANITEDKGLAEVYGDFSALNPRKSSYSRVRASCSGQYLCEWAGLEVQMPAQNPKVIITARDNAGNERNYTRSFDLPLDTVGPKVSSISAQYGDFLKSKGNEIKVELIEAGSGMTKAEAYLNYFSLNPSVSAKRADNCSLEGNWVCRWSGIDASGIKNGDLVTLSIASMRDDAGNSYMIDATGTSKDFVYDDVPPVFRNITIAPLGTGIDVLTMADVAEIKAYILENGSGIDAANVLADFSVFGAGNVPAESCDIDNSTGTYICVWQYSGQYKKGPVKLRVEAIDRAGNLKDSSSDRIYGISSVVDTKQLVVDWWDEKARVGNVPPLNRNFIWMSSVGALERVEIELMSKGGANRYVQAMNVQGCKGSYTRKGESDIFDSFSVKSQYYYPGQSRHKKYIILNIPQYDRKGISEVESIKVNCTVEIIQSATKNSDILTPNEIAYAEFEIPLQSGIFEAPDSAVIGKLNEKNSTIQTLNSLISNIRWITGFMTPLCKLVSTLRQIVSGVAVLMVAAGQVPYLKFLGVSGQALTGVSDYFTTVIWRGGANAGISVLSTKNFISLGFWCDLVLCEDCSNFWKGSIMYMTADAGSKPTNQADAAKAFDEKLGSQSYMKWADPQKTMGNLWGIQGQPVEDQQKGTSNNALLTPEQRAAGLASTNPAIYFDPKKSLLTAVICVPPCLTGIEGKLQAYKQILITYNACVNVAAVRGEDMGQCEEFLSAEICQQIVWEFWGIIDSFIKKVLVNYAMYITVNQLRQLAKSQCTSANDAWSISCLGQRIFDIIDVFATMAGTMQAVNELMNHEWFRQADSQNQQQAEDHINSELDRKDKKGYGTMPNY